MVDISQSSKLNNHQLPGRSCSWKGQGSESLYILTLFLPGYMVWECTDFARPSNGIGIYLQHQLIEYHLELSLTTGTLTAGWGRESALQTFLYVLKGTPAITPQGHVRHTAIAYAAYTRSTLHNILSSLGYIYSSCYDNNRISFSLNLFFLKHPQSNNTIQGALKMF